MSNPFAIAVLTPEGPAYVGECIHALIPGSEGMFGVLANHMNLVASIKPGLITIETNLEKPIKIVVSGGIAEVNSLGLSVLIEEAINVENIDLEKTKTELNEINHRLSLAESEIQKIDLTAKAAFFHEMVEARINDF